MERFGGHRKIAAAPGAVQQVLAVASGRCVVVPGSSEAAERGERPFPNLTICGAAQRQRLFEAEFGMRGVPGVERARRNVDEQAGGGGAQFAALIAGQRLTDVPHGVSASTGVEL